MDPMDTVSASEDREFVSLPPPMHHDPESARLDIAAWDAFHRAERHELQAWHGRLYTAGRLLFGAIFLGTALEKLVHFTQTARALDAGGFTDASVLVAFAAVIELGGGLMLVAGWRVRAAAVALVGYLATVTFLLNWNLAVPLNRARALTGLCSIAGLLLLGAHGAGRASVDRLEVRRARARLQSVH